VSPHFNSLYLPALVAHADWGSNAAKRSLAVAVRNKGRYTALPPEPIKAPQSLLDVLRQMAGQRGSILLGFDFPIGLPIRYAEKLGITNFLTILPLFGQGEWASFYQPASSPGQISLRRPFYPAKPGGARHKFLLEGLSVPDIQDLRRCCELAHPNRRAASPLFWTLGAQQVGKAAISGWRDVIGPALRHPQPGIHLWPFEGPLADLLEQGSIAIAETYPGEVYQALKLQFPSITELNQRFPERTPIQKSGKRSQAARIWNATPLLAWARYSGVELDPQLERLIKTGFGPAPGAEDPFDATVGLFGMLNVILGFQPEWVEPPDGNWLEIIRNVEGWILGQVDWPV
jgi:hypothetical protein